MENSIINAVNLFPSFALNYPNKFIDKAFAGEPKHIIEHLQSKFDSAYKKHSPIGAMVAFWAELDIENRISLAKFIISIQK